MSRLTNDVDNISTTISDSDSTDNVCIYYYGYLLRHGMAEYIADCCGMLSVVLIYLLTRAVTKRTRKLFREQQQILGELNGQVEESISSLTMVKAFCREEAMIEQFRANNDRFCEMAV